MIRRAMLGCALAALGLGAAPAHADEIELETKTYDLSALVITTSGAANIGGTIFAPPGLPVSRVVAVDQTGTPAPLQVAQDLDGDGFSGEIGEPNARGCGQVDLTTSSVTFDPSRQVATFVSTVGVDQNAPGQVHCVGSVATTGTLTLYGIL
jgi:hypothetical protein